MEDVRRDAAPPHRSQNYFYAVFCIDKEIENRRSELPNKDVS